MRLFDLDNIHGFTLTEEAEKFLIKYLNAEFTADYLEVIIDIDGDIVVSEEEYRDLLELLKSKNLVNKHEA